MNRLGLLALGVLVLTACQSAAQYSTSSSSHQIPVGSRLELLKPLDIPAASATVRLQFGKFVTRFHTQEFEPVCVFESRIVGETAQRIEPDVFEITRVRTDYNSVSAQAAGGFIKTRATIEVGIVGDPGSRQYYKTEMFLHSKKQPQILAMTCQHAWETGSSGLELRPLTIAEMRQAMGEYFALHLPGEK